MLTSFARNIASVLSTTLLSEDLPVNQSSGNLLKRIQDAQPSLEIATNQSEGSETPSNASFSRYPRSSSNERETIFQNPYVTNPPRYSKYHESISSYKPYEFAVNSRIPYNEVNTPGNLNMINTKENSVNEDVNPPPLHYPSPGFRYKPELIDPLSNSNHYARLADLHYHRLSTQRPVDPGQHSTTPEQEINTDENENINQIARITRRPYNLNYRGSFHNSYYTPGFQGYPELYPRERPVESEDRYVTDGRDESDPSRLEDQNQVQTALGGYDYGPRFHYGLPPYHDAFYHGFPGFYPRPYNDTFHSGYNNKETQSDGNGTGPQPYGPPFYHHPRFGPHQRPFYPNFYGRPVQPPQNPADNQENSEQIVTPENGRGNNATYHGYPPFGYPPYPYYGPHYGGFNLHGYPLTVPFFGGHRFGHGFHDHLFSGIKSVPYLNFYHHFPSVHWHPPYGYHHYDHRPATTTEKPAEKTVNENSEASASNSETEMLSEIKSSERTRSSPSRGYKKRSGFVTKESSKVAKDRIVM